MKPFDSLIMPGRLGALGLTALVLFVGCSSDQFGSELSSRPQPRPIRQTQGTTINLPQDQPFNITLQRSTDEPGLAGQATADASVKGAGEAAASASVTSGGTAEAMFQIGHALTNATEQQADFDFTVRFQYEFEAQATPDVGLPDAAIGLRLYARDDRGGLLRDMTLATYSTESGTTKRRSSEDVGFTLTVAPGGTISVFLAGQAKGEVPDDRSMSASLKLSGLTMQVVTRPAPAVRAAGHEQD